MFRQGLTERLHLQCCKSGWKVESDVSVKQSRHLAIHYKTLDKVHSKHDCSIKDHSWE